VRSLRSARRWTPEKPAAGPTGCLWRPGGRQLAAAVLAAALLGAACQSDARSGDTGGEADRPPLLIGQENVVTVTRGTVIAGPILSGELRPRHEAVLRAQVGGAVLEVMAEEGEAVRSGALLGRIESRTLEDSRRSALSAVRSAEDALLVAERDAERTAALVDAGALAAREVDLARNSVSAGQAQLEDARSRLADVDAQLADTVIRSPLSGVVAERAVNAGDIVAVGAELYTVVDPSSMRLEASVPSDSLSELRVGAPVAVEVRGVHAMVDGRIERIAPRTDPVTRQLPIYVAIPNVEGRLVGGLYAEGRVVTESASGLVVPTNAVNTTGLMPWVLRLSGGRTERVDVSLGLRDPRTERVEVTSGLAEGDILLRGSAQGIAPGTPVQVTGLP
jgi:RND family efflux transporter MFP subunit